MLCFYVAIILTYCKQLYVVRRWMWSQVLFQMLFEVLKRQSLQPCQTIKKAFSSVCECGSVCCNAFAATTATTTKKRTKKRKKKKKEHPISEQTNKTDTPYSEWIKQQHEQQQQQHLRPQQPFIVRSFKYSKNG